MTPPVPQATQAAQAPSRDASDMLARFRDGDRQAFQEIVGAFHARLVQFFYRLCWDRDRAEDLTQDLFLKLLRGADSYRPQGRLSTFVFRVATNLWIDHYRAQKPRGRLYSLDQAMLKGEPVLGHAQRGGEQRPAAMDALIQEEEKDRLREALCCLTEPHRLVFELAVYQQLPYAEIARVLEIPVGTVKSRMHNSVRALRREMHVGGGHKGVAQRPFRGRLTGGGAG
ncbi:MAG: RNA polymerase sigma factor [Planctomycetota bacterium]